MVTKVMVTGVKVGPHTTVRDFGDKVWDNINGNKNMRQFGVAHEI